MVVLRARFLCLGLRFLLQALPRDPWSLLVHPDLTTKQLVCSRQSTALCLLSIWSQFHGFAYSKTSPTPQRAKRSTTQSWNSSGEHFGNFPSRVILGFGWRPVVTHPATPTRLALPKCHWYCSAQCSSADYLGQGKASAYININIHQHKSACPSAALNLPPPTFDFHFLFCGNFVQPGFAQRHSPNPAPAAFLWVGGQSQQTLWEVFAGERMSEALAQQLHTSLIESHWVKNQLQKTPHPHSTNLMLARFCTSKSNERNKCWQK